MYFFTFLAPLFPIFKVIKFWPRKRQIKCENLRPQTVSFLRIIGIIYIFSAFFIPPGIFFHPSQKYQKSFTLMYDVPLILTRSGIRISSYPFSFPSFPVTGFSVVYFLAVVPGFGKGSIKFPIIFFKKVSIHFSMCEFIKVFGDVISLVQPSLRNLLLGCK